MTPFCEGCGQEFIGAYLDYNDLCPDCASAAKAQTMTIQIKDSLTPEHFWVRFILDGSVIVEDIVASREAELLKEVKEVEVERCPGPT